MADWSIGRKVKARTLLIVACLGVFLYIVQGMPDVIAKVRVGGREELPLARLFLASAMLFVYLTAAFTGVGFAIVSWISIAVIGSSVIFELLFLVPALPSDATALYAGLTALRIVVLYCLVANLIDHRRKG